MEKSPHGKKKYILRMHASVMERILKHLSRLSRGASCYLSTRAWIKEAIAQKLNRDEAQLMPKIPKNSHVLLEIESDMLERLEKQVAMIKKIKGSYSIKSWIMDAIEDRLLHESLPIKAAPKELAETSEDSTLLL